MPTKVSLLRTQSEQSAALRALAPLQQQNTRDPALEYQIYQMAAGLRSGARGAVVGRNIWGEDNLEHAARAYAAVLHGGISPNEAVTGA